MIVCVGDLMVDVFSDGPGEQRRHPGGKAAIYAVTIRALGGDAAVVGCIGDDADGKAVSKALAVTGVDRSGVVVHSTEATGADFFEGGDWRMERGANWALTPEQVRSSLASLADGGRNVDAVIINQGISLEAAQEAVGYARQNGLFTVLHLGPEAVEDRRRVSPEFYPLADVIVLSQREADFLAEDLGLGVAGLPSAELARLLFDRTEPRWALLLTRGVGGSDLVVRRADGGAEQAVVSPSSIDEHEVERHIGAGDSLLGAWISQLVGRGATSVTASTGMVVEALDRSTRLAAVTLQFPGTLTTAVYHPERLLAG